MNYLQKDIRKFSVCTHIQAYGVRGSSSWKYHREGVPTLNLDNSMETVTLSSVVGLSANGNRPDGIAFPTVVLDQLATIGCVLITDNEFHRNRPYNIGEREIAAYLRTKGYKYTDHTDYGVWEKYDD